MSGTSEHIHDSRSGRRPARTGPQPRKQGISRQTWAMIRRRAVLILSITLTFVVCLYTAAIMLEGHRATWVVAVLFWAGFAAICRLVHELGHAAAAWAVGWRVHLIVVGPFAFAPRRRRFFRHSNRGDRQDFGGWVTATPPPGSSWKDGRIPFILGGATGNFMLAAVSVLAAYALYEPDRSLAVGLAGLAGVSLIDMVANLVPWSGAGGGRNDGALLIDAFRGEEPSILAQTIARLAGMEHDGISAEEWDVSLLNDLVSDPSVDRADIDPLLINYALSVGDLAAAKRILERYVKASPRGNFDRHCTYALAVAMIDGDGPRAAEILDEVPEEEARELFSFWRAQAATMHLLGRREEALAAIRSARKAIGNSGRAPDEDDEAVFRAIEEGRDLPHLEPRRRLSEDLIGRRTAGPWDPPRSADAEP